MGENVSKYVQIPEYFYRTPEYNKEKIEEAIKNFNETLIFLNNKIILMNNNTIKYIKEAKKLYELNNKSGALHQLKLKKMYEKEIRKIESIKFNIESNILHMESISVMLETVSTIKNTYSYIKLINNNLDISKIENIIDSLYEQKETTNEIESILIENTTDEFDDDELLQELENNRYVINNESVNNQVINNESVNNESVNNESVNNESVNNESVNNQVINNESVNNKLNGDNVVSNNLFDLFPVITNHSNNKKGELLCT